MDALKRELSTSVIEQLKSKGFSQSEIAAIYGVTRQAVSWNLKTYGSALSTRQIVNQAWPWKTGLGHDTTFHINVFGTMVSSCELKARE